jgi:hypothetical protein
MQYYKATIEVLIEADSEADACDAINEGLRPLLREFCEDETPWIDWRYFTEETGPKEHDGEGFEYA